MFTGPAPDKKIEIPIRKARDLCWACHGKKFLAVPVCAVRGLDVVATLVTMLRFHSGRSQEREAPLHPTRAARPATAERTNGRLAQRNSVTKE